MPIMLLTAPGPPRHASDLTGAQTTTVNRREALEYAAFAVLALGAGWVERHGAGLGGLWSVAPGLAATLPLIVACRAWRLPLLWLLVAAALPVSIIATAVLAPGGWAGSERSAAYGYGALAFVAVAAFARTPARRLVAAMTLALLVLDQFAQSWLAWWGSQNPFRMLAGSFDWHNQYGAFCAAGVVLCLTLALLAEPRRLRGVAVFVAALLMTGLLGSASRASVAAALAACLVALLVAIRSMGTARAVGRAAVVVVASLVVGVFLRSTLFFEQWSWPWTPLLGRSVAAAGGASYQAVTDNGSARLSFWRAGLEMAGDRPLTGPGLSTFAGESRWFVPIGAGRSVDPHNELVRAAAEGGLLGVLPVALVVLLALVLAAKWARTWWEWPNEAVAEPAVVAGLLSAGVLIVHALVDFDWSYPSLVMAAGWSLALAAAGSVRPRQHRRPSPAGAVLIVVALVAALAGSLADDRSRAAIAGAAASDVSLERSQSLLRAAWSPLHPDHRLPIFAVATAVNRGTPVPAWTLAALRERAGVDAMAALSLSRAELSRGDRAQALQRMRLLAQRDPARGAELVTGYADLLQRDGQSALAAETMARLLTLRVVQRKPLAPDSNPVQLAKKLATGSPGPAACIAALSLPRRVSASGATAPPACVVYTEGDVVR